MAEAANVSFKSDYSELVGFYFEIKELIAAAEREDGEQRISISAISELRSVLDHIMRAQNVEYGLVSETDIKEISGLSAEQYCKKNYDKAYGHLYRAGYDAYDCISIGMIDRIDRSLNGVSREALHTIIPDAISKVVNPYKKAKNLFTSAKVKKDVESHVQEKKQFQIYEEANKSLYDIRELLDSCESQMVEYDKEQKKKTVSQRLFVIGLSLFSLIAGYLIRKYIS